MFNNVKKLSIMPTKLFFLAFILFIFQNKIYSQDKSDTYFKIPVSLLVCQQKGDPKEVEIDIIDSQSRFVLKSWIESSDDNSSHWLVFQDIYNAKEIDITILAVSKGASWLVRKHIPFDKFKSADSLTVEIINPKMDPFYKNSILYNAGYIVNLAIYWRDKSGNRIFYGESRPSPTYSRKRSFSKSIRKLLKNCK
jgi:hypothetical protein